MSPRYLRLAGGFVVGATLLLELGCQSSSSGSGATGSAGAAGTSDAVNRAGSAGQGNGVGPASDLASVSVARRLSRSEIDNTVRDLLGDGTNPASTILPEDEYTPFDNDSTRQKASAALIDSLEATANLIAEHVLTPANRAHVVPCAPSGPGDAACFERVIRTVGERLFRRPLVDDEVRAYLTLQSYATEDNLAVVHDFYTAVGLLLRSMLQDPEFLYRIEVGTKTAQAGVLRLTSYEIATRLSFLVLGSSPDAALLALGKTDGLVDSQARRAEASRLLMDARARDQIHRFHAMWLGYRAIPATPALAAAFNLETTKLIDRVVFDQPASYLTLFTSPETYLNDALALQYGLPKPAGGEGWVPYGASGRAGILSQGSVLAAFSKFSDTSPTQRGIFVQTRLLCNTVLPPPASVNVDQPPSAPDSLCKLDRYAAHRAVPSCASCHQNLDPIGYGLEQYDIGGRYRTHDDAHAECLIPGTGELPGYGTFSGPAELGRKLVDSGKLEQCFVQKLLSFAVGRALRPEESTAATEFADSFKASDYSLKELLLDYVASDRFALRQEEPVP